MMRIFTPNHVDMQIHAELIGKGGVKLVRQIGVKFSYANRPI